ncbi:MAG: hypothetical protein HYR56_08230, partial [Acidobacteria bacterium]|nr:hypothetical protein [Acidobacteriota bacterium]
MKRITIFIITTIGFCFFLQAANFKRGFMAASQPVSASTTHLNQPANPRSPGYPWINLQVARDGPDDSAWQARLAADAARPLALAAGDFDEDGVPDLVSGYAVAGHGLLSLQRGNVDALWPHTPEAAQRKAAGTFTAAPFLAPGRVFELPEQPDFIGAGDFNADGHQDVVVAALGSQELHWLAGNGAGEFAEVQSVKLSGAVTALLAGEINRADGLADVVVGVTSETGARALIFEGPQGALQRQPEALVLPAPATAFGLGQLDEDYPYDLAIAAGNELLIVHGRDRQLPLDGGKDSVAPPARIQHQRFHYNIEALALGDFAGGGAQDIALLDAAGTVSLVTPQDQADNQQWGRLTGQIQAGSAREAAAAFGFAKTQLIRAHVSSRQVDDLLVLRPQQPLEIVLGEALSGEAQKRVESVVPAIPQTPIALETAGQPVAALPMRLNADGLSDLVLLTQGGPNALVFATSAPLRTFTVNSTLLSSDANPGDGVCAIAASSGGGCTLPAAIEEANASAGADLINFSSSIRQLDKFKLKTVTETVTIDAAASGGVTLDGGGTAGSGVIALGSSATNCLVRGFAFYGYHDIQSLDGVINVLGNGHTIEGNFFGLDITGTQAKLTRGGKYIRVAGKNLTIGGMTAAARNYFAAGNNPDTDSGQAIELGGGENKVLGNYFGTDSNGQNQIPEQGYRNAIKIYSANNVIGGINGTIAGRCAGPCNLLSMKGLAVWVSAGNGNQIQGNYVNTDVTSAKLFWSGNRAVLLETSNNTIGGTADGAGNLITSASVSGKYGIGVEIDTGIGNKILRNSIFSNYDLGIDLMPLSVTPNDAGDTDTGANELQNYPVLSANPNGSATGTLDSKPNTTYTIEFFANTACDLTGYGEGERFLQAISVTTDGQGKATFTVPAGQNVTATATDPAGNTSEFSACLSVAAGKQLSVNLESLSFSGTVGQANPAAQTFTLSNIGSSTVNWQATASTAAGGNWLSVNPPSGSLNAGQSATLAAAVDISALWSDVYDGTLTLSTTTPGSSPAQVSVKLTVGCPLENSFSAEVAAPSCSDVLTITSYEPPIAAYSPDELKAKLFKANVTYLLQSKKNAELVLRLFDQNGNLMGSSEFVPLGRVLPLPTTPPSIESRIPGASLALRSDSCALKLQALLIDESRNVFKRSQEIVYPVNSANCSNSVEFLNPRIDGVPADQAQLKPNTTIKFECDLRYQLISDSHGGNLTLQAFSLADNGQTSLGNPTRTAVAQTTSGPQTKTNLSLTINVPGNASGLKLETKLLDSKDAVLDQEALTYPVGTLSLEFGKHNRSPGVFTPFGAIPVFLAGYPLRDQVALESSETLAIRTRQELGDEYKGATVGLFLQLAQKNGQLVGASRSLVTGEISTTPGKLLIPDIFSAVMPLLVSRNDQILLTLMIEFPNGRKVLVPPIVIPVDLVRIVPDANQFPKQTYYLLVGRSERFRFKLAYNAARSGTNRIEARVSFKVLGAYGGEKPLGVLRQLQVSGLETFEFPVDIPYLTTNLRLRFYLVNDAHVPAETFSEEVEFNLFKLAEPIPIPPGITQQVVNDLGVTIQTQRNTAPRVINGARAARDIAESIEFITLEQNPSEVRRQTQTAPDTAALFRDFTGVNTVWLFAPAIPNDGSFVADLTFQYSAADLPDDPNLIEANLKVIAFDPATGQLEAYPTTLNTAQKTATARVTSLAPRYTLGAFGPFANKVLNAPLLRDEANFSAPLYLNNQGTALASLTLRAFDEQGQPLGNTATITLAAGQTLTRTPTELFRLMQPVSSGWVQIWSNQKAVAVWQMPGQGNRLDAFRLEGAASGSQLLTNLVYDATWTTEIYLANTTKFYNNLTLELRNTAGAQVGVRETTLAPKAVLTGRLQDLFLDISAPFNGYLVIRGDHEMCATVLHESSNELLAFNARPLLPGDPTPTKLYAPSAVELPGEIATTVNLVNPTASAATLRLRLIEEEGASFGAPVNLTLTPGQQYQRTLRQLFNLGPNAFFFGALVIESNLSGVYGEISLSDPTNAQSFRAAFPLTSELGTNFVVGHVDNRLESFTQFALFNPNAQTAQVEIKIYQPDGTLRGSGRERIPANNTLLAYVDEIVAASGGQFGGSFTISSDVPLAADAAFGALSGQMLAALTPQRLDTLATRALATVSAANYRGDPLAAETIVAAFGTGMAVATQAAASVPLPFTLAGTNVRVSDRLSAERFAPLFFVSSQQVNYLIPAGTATG